MMSDIEKQVNYIVTSNIQTRRRAGAARGFWLGKCWRQLSAVRTLAQMRKLGPARTHGNGCRFLAAVCG
jgi:hypothetical protein